MDLIDPSFRDGGFRQPAEWEKHAACWLAWPSQESLWQSHLPEAQKEFVVLCEAIAGWDRERRTADGEPLEILTEDSTASQAAQAALGHLPARFHLIPYGDIWVRDTGPIFLLSKINKVVAARFLFNGWGGKYQLEYDPEVSGRVAQAALKPQYSFPWVLEGGSLDVDGEGSCLTTRQCLLNPNRNPHLTQTELEGVLSDVLGISKVLWLDRGLLNDHTDGHIDTLARFVAPGRVLCMHPEDANDPNRDTLLDIEKALRSFTDAKGRRLEVTTMPSPGEIRDEDGKIMPASYANFYISNTTVVVPVYGSPHDAAATEQIARCFPDRKTVGLSASAILSGGGAFHCITQQQPEGI